jgi:hypothetical protein
MHPPTTGTAATTAGLFAAWLAHDLEEAFTLQETSRRVAGRLPEWVPAPPEWREHGLPRRHIVVAVSVMGC